MIFSFPFLGPLSTPSGNGSPLFRFFSSFLLALFSFWQNRPYPSSSPPSTFPPLPTPFFRSPPFPLPLFSLDMTAIVGAPPRRLFFFRVIAGQMPAVRCFLHLLFSKVGRPLLLDISFRNYYIKKFFERFFAFYFFSGPPATSSPLPGPLPLGPVFCFCSFGLSD